MGTRTKAIQRTLKSVEALTQTETKLILPDMDKEIFEDE